MENHKNFQKACIVVCVGIPGAGKTTFCKRLHEILKNTYNFIYNNYDDYCKGNFSNEKRKEILQSVERYLTTRGESEEPIVILIDDNMFYKSMRSEYKQIAKRYHTSFLQLYFEVDLETALQRNSIRDCKVPEEIICDMFKKLEVPIKNCYKINSNVNFTDAYIENIQNVIDEALQNPLEENIIEKRVIVEDSKLQKVDIILRQIVSEKIKENKFRALEFVHRRKEIFAKIKEGEILISDNLDMEKIHLMEYFS